MTFIQSKKLPLTALIAIAFIIFSFGEALALRVIPQRLVLKPDVKLEYMFVKNNSNKTESYRFGWKHMAMDKDGNVLNLDKLGMENAPPGYRPADDIIRFSPRRATLKPGETQRITFMVNRGKSLPDGEYRSHFLFEREPEVRNPNQNNMKPTGDEAAEPSVAFNVLVSRAVPIYVVNGKTNASLSLIEASVKKNAQKQQESQPDHLAHFKVRKEGNRSVIGIAEVFCTSGGEEIKISKPAKVFAVYAEGEFRNEQTAVEMPSGGCSSYRIIVKGHPDDMLAGQILIDQVFK